MFFPTAQVDHGIRSLGGRPKGRGWVEVMRLALIGDDQKSIRNVCFCLQVRYQDIVLLGPAGLGVPELLSDAAPDTGGTRQLPAWYPHHRSHRAASGGSPMSRCWCSAMTRLT